MLLFPAKNISASDLSVRAVSFVPTTVECNGEGIYLANDPLLGVILGTPDGDLLAHYMSLTGVLEQIGYIVNYDSANNIIEILTPGSPAPEYVPGVSSLSIQASGGVRGAAFNEFIVKINGTELELGENKVLSVLRGTEAHPQFFLPMRQVLEALGYEIGYDGETGMIELVKGEGAIANE